MANDLPIKALAKLGKALAGLPDACELLESLDKTKEASTAEIAKLKKEAADLKAGVTKLEADIAKAQQIAIAIVESAKKDAETIIAKADIDGQEMLNQIRDLSDKTNAEVNASKARINDLGVIEAALSEKIAKLTKQEGDILARIADHKAKLLKALE